MGGYRTGSSRKVSGPEMLVSVVRSAKRRQSALLATSNEVALKIVHAAFHSKKVITSPAAKAQHESIQTVAPAISPMITVDAWLIARHMPRNPPPTTKIHATPCAKPRPTSFLPG